MTNLEVRFWDKVGPADDRGCMPWLAAKDECGYGRFGRNGRNTRAIRTALELATGEIVPKGLSVCHSCDNPGCVNPAHLFIATHAENMADMAAKGRSADVRGVRNPKARLSEADVREIRMSTAGHAELGRRFGVTRNAIFAIRKRRVWRTVE